MRTRVAVFRLLADIQVVFNETKLDRIASDELCRRLGLVETSPWIEYYKTREVITPTQLAALLKQFSIRPGDVWISGHTLRGYERGWFSDVWTRYLDDATTPVNPSPGFPGTSVQDTNRFRR